MSQVICDYPASGSKLYLRTQILLIQSEEHKKNTKWARQLDREPTPEELARHWYASQAHVVFRRRWVEEGKAFDLMRQVGLQ